MMIFKKLIKFYDEHSVIKLCFLALTIWVAHYINFQYLGLYEDDYAYISPPFGWTLSDLIQNIISFFRGWPQGRPIGFFLGTTLPYIGARIGGLQVIYVMGFFVVTLNAFLFYKLLKKVSSETIATIGALIFCLFPADTTHSFLMHDFGLQTAITFFLVASLCYLSGKSVWAYVLILLSLLTYESPFFVFFAIPLLVNKWDQTLTRKIIRNGAILLGIILAVGIIRFFLGESRVMGTNLLGFNTIYKIVSGMVIGPATSLFLFVYGPVHTLLHWNRELWGVLAACLVAFAVVFPRLIKIETLERKVDRLFTFRSRVFTFSIASQIPVSYSNVVKLFLTGLIMLCLAYTASFTHYPPTATFGRVTSVHLAAAIGGSIIFACICSVLLAISNEYRFKKIVLMVLVLYFSLVVSYRYSIQLDFKQAWLNQRSFWTNVIETSPDVTDGTIIFVLNHDLPQTRYIQSNSWADPIMLMQIYAFSKDWKTPPRLFVVQNLDDTLIPDGDHFKWNVPTATWLSHWEVLPKSNTILLEMDNGKLIRRFGSININGLNLELKPLLPSSTLEKGFLYDLLIY
jgi:hypothetical protein